MGNEMPLLPGESIESAQLRMDAVVRDMMSQVSSCRGKGNKD
jgi:hypothetical protein